MKTYIGKPTNRPQVSIPQQPKANPEAIGKQTIDVPRAAAVSTAKPVSHDEIAKRAYEIYLESGCMEGRDEQNWTQAERELKK